MRSRASPRAQRGVALLALIAVAVMVFGYVLASRLNAASQFVAANRDENARVLAQAKKALIGWMALNAASNDTNPGRLPCPEAPAYYGDPVQEGIAAGNCTLPAVGRLPWRTLGLDRLVDAAGEPLWYVVSPAWAIPSAGATLTINTETVGQLTLDGNEAVALVIAPGPVMAVQAGTGCAAWTQTRPATGAPDLRNYLECENADSPADTSFVGSRVGQSFNDQVLRISSADVMPALEAAIADRMQRQIAPAIKAAAYTSATYSGLPSGVPLYPYPAPFADPTTSNYRVTGIPTYPYPNASAPYYGDPPWPTGGYPNPANPQGLLPFNQISSSCTSPPPCTTLPITLPSTLRSTLSGYIVSYSCSTSATEVLCTGQYHEDDTTPTNNVRPEMAVTFDRFVSGFRTLVASPAGQTLVEARDDGSSGAWTTVAATIVQIRINDGYTALPDGYTPPPGSMTIRFRATLPNIDAMGWGTTADFRMRLYRAVVTDHAVVNRDDATTGWFVRNAWYRSTYFAVAQPNTPDRLPSIGCSAASGDCLRFNDNSTYNIRALLVLAGRRLPTQGARPSGAVLDYVESQNGDDGTLYEQRMPRMNQTAITSPFYAPWNDRVILVDWDSASPPNASQALTVSPMRVVALP